LHYKVSSCGRRSDKKICTAKIVPLEGVAIKTFAL